MTIFENIKQLIDHLETKEQITAVRKLLILREREIENDGK
jgi:hypothetical protein